MDAMNHLRPFFIVFLIFGRCHLDKSHKIGYWFTLAYNIIGVILSGFCLIYSLILPRLDGDFHFNLTYSYQNISFLICAVITSVIMFRLSHRKAFILSYFEDSKTSLSFWGKFLSFSGLSVVICWSVATFIIPFIVDKERTMISFKYCNWANITSPYCDIILSSTVYKFSVYPIFVFPFFVTAYCGIIAEEFASTNEEMRHCEDIFEPANPAIER